MYKFIATYYCEDDDFKVIKEFYYNTDQLPDGHMLFRRNIWHIVLDEAIDFGYDNEWVLCSFREVIHDSEI